MLIPDPKTLMSEAAFRFVNESHKLLIGDRWLDAQSGATVDVIDPGTGRVIAKVPAADSADVDLAVAAAREAFDNGPWSRMTASARGKLIWQFADLIEANARSLAEVESLDTGRALYECQIVDVPGSVEMLRYMAGWASKINGETMNVAMPCDFHTYTVREAVGVVAIIVPWNYPLELAVWRMAPALAAGCTIILKPAEQTPLNAIRLGQLAQECGFPPGVINVVTGYGETAGAALSAHMDVDAISFTGSTETGRLIVKAAAGNMKRVFLELGGKSPAIVFADADLTAAIPGVAGSIFFSAGQVCTAGSRLLVHASIFDRVVAGVAEIAATMTLGHGLAAGTQLGPLVSSDQMDRVSGYLDAGRRDGVTIVTGGHRVGTEGYYMQPTVITNTSAQMSIYREEVFGPVLCAVPFDDDDMDRVAAMANDTVYGLHASIWTQNLRLAHMMARKVKAGNVCINTHNFFDPAFPMGGYKQSGWGRASGFQAIEHYTEVKGVVAKL
ncbi:aldehyde dehydrogenase family protein [Acidisoma cladoniae]|uniref:aldehyde dehydrogenase family protein n=1 Tax=Acidisoma cladoniae TaxID=3040935 RepID=UPI00254D8CC3|nr:aldehyde dehydrogenase family protein [Acidisoma sp. PAMC 29798]